MNIAPNIGDKVLVYKRETDSYREAEVIRVYDEDTYTQEHYHEGRPEWDTRTNNMVLIDVRILETGRMSRAHFLDGLKEYKE